MRLETRSRRPRAFTLIEATISIIIVGVMFVAALNTVGMAARSHVKRSGSDVAYSLAHELMGEILQCHYQDPEAVALVADPTFGPEADETSTPTRADFDDIDDYNGWIASPPEDRQGTPLDVDAKYERTVQVEFVDPSTPAALGTSELAGETGLKRVTVTVASPDQSFSLVALRGSASSYDREPAVVGTFLRWVGVTLQLGEQGRTMVGGTSVMNQTSLGDDP